MAFWRFVLVTGAVAGPMLFSGFGCSRELPPPPQEVLKQAAETIPPVIEFGTPVSNDAGTSSKVVVKT